MEGVRSAGNHSQTPTMHVDDLDQNEIYPTGFPSKHSMSTSVCPVPILPSLPPEIDHHVFEVTCKENTHGMILSFDIILNFHG